MSAVVIATHHPSLVMFKPIIEQDASTDDPFCTSKV